MRRRDFVKLMVSAGGATLAPGCGRVAPGRAATSRRVYLVAFDGLDYRIARRLLDAGRLPNLARLAEGGSFLPLGTSTPPQTPVAFSSIISGADPGLHQVFDFIHREVAPRDSALIMRPYFSTAKVETPENNWAVPLGSWRFLLTGGQTAQLRRGPAFWDYLIEHGIDTSVYYVPANYPPEMPSGPGRFRAISGMGTPDLLGGYGEFTLFTPGVGRQGRQVGGGRFAFLSMLGNRGRAELLGPENYLRQPDAAGRVPRMTVPIDIVRDPAAPVAKIVIGGTTLLLNEGEWSDWIGVLFQTALPGSSVVGALGAPTAMPGMVRLFLKQVHPKFELYVSPVNMDPLEPANQISVPQDFARDLARRHGRFYTAGIPEDTKALSHGALAEEQFLEQTRLALNERIDHYRQALAELDGGCLFFYFGDTDLVQHMFWRDCDPDHPGRDPRQGDQFAQVVEELYVKADGLVGDLLKHATDDDTILVFSDHGFTTFRRGFNLNSWLADNGFLADRPGSLHADSEMFVDVDWARTRAYGLGLNGLYLNLAGRERHGTVKSAARGSVLAELRDKLLEVRDDDGSRIVERVDFVEDIYPGADPLIAPDVLIGYSDGYRASWGTVLGARPHDHVENNLDRWSGDHSLSARLVPGVLFSNRRVAIEDPTVSDIAPTVLAAYQIATPPQMTGRPLFETPSEKSAG
ncbi:MAG: alkaline phosphatase family protein [Pirellulales bacterium]